MGQILDTVPNHMGIGNDNPWWYDVLENGPASTYSAYFDIAWQSSPRPELRDRLLLPVLGDAYGKVLESRATPPGLRERRLYDPLFRPPLSRRAPHV